MAPRPALLQLLLEQPAAGQRVSEAFVCSCRVRKVASGSAVFDVLSEETLEGTVKEAALPPRGYNQLPTSGVLSYQDGEGEEQLIPYGLGDLKVCCVYIMLLGGAAGDSWTA